MKLYGYLYKTTNIKNGKLYIGQKKGAFSKSYLGSGIHIKNAIKGTGKQFFRVELICYLSTSQQLDEFEKHMISKYREIVGKDAIYNIADGGKWTTIGYNSSGTKNGFYGKTHSSIVRKIISKTHKGKKYSDIHRKNMSIGKVKSKEKYKEAFSKLLIKHGIKPAVSHENR